MSVIVYPHHQKVATAIRLTKVKAFLLDKSSVVKVDPGQSGGRSFRSQFAEGQVHADQGM